MVIGRALGVQHEVHAARRVAGAHAGLDAQLVGRVLEFCEIERGGDIALDERPPHTVLVGGGIDLEADEAVHRHEGGLGVAVPGHGEPAFDGGPVEVVAELGVAGDGE